MDITPLIPAGLQIIQGYAGGRFKINGKSYDSAVLVMPERTLLWPVKGVDQITARDFLPLSESGTEVLFIGCGIGAQPLAASIRQELRAQGIIVEAMDTGAACRTYNVLVAEGRRVAAALLPA